MKAVRIHEHGGPDTLLYEDAPDPDPPSHGAVLVRLKACALNHRDIEGRKGSRGVSGLQMPLPQILGADGAGLVDDVGEGVEGTAEGDEVILTHVIGCGHCPWCLRGWDRYCSRRETLGIHRPGTYAQYITVPSANVLPKPPNLTVEEAASLALGLLTCWPLLVTRGRITAGEEVLIHAAGSGIGSLSIQIAKALGARILTTTSTDTKCQRALELGADAAINYRETNIIEETLRLTDGRGVDAIVDCIGGPPLVDSVRALAVGGRLLTCASGSLAGDALPLSLAPLRDRRAELIFSALGSKGELHNALRLVKQGKVRPVLHQRLPLQDVRLAHRILEAGQQFGKIVLQIP